MRMLLLSIFSILLFLLLVEINQRIYRRKHLGDLGRDSDYASRVYEQIPGSLQSTFIVDKPPSPLQQIELVEPRQEPKPPR